MCNVLRNNVTTRRTPKLNNPSNLTRRVASRSSAAVSAVLQATRHFISLKLELVIIVVFKMAFEDETLIISQYPEKYDQHELS